MCTMIGSKVVSNMELFKLLRERDNLEEEMGELKEALREVNNEIREVRRENGLPNY